MKYYLIAGEKSGDLHASNLIKSLKKLDIEAQFRGWGGDEMEAAGMHLAKHYKDTAFMGFWEVFVNLLKIRKLFSECKKDLLQWQPNVVILVDYAGFNLRMAKFAKLKGFKVYYYISPKLWAWGQKRALKIKKYVDHLFAIMYFEKAFYAQFGFNNVDYVGNPVLDAVDNFEPNEYFVHKYHLESKPIIAILPGSRKQEVANILAKTLEIVPQYPEYYWVVAGVSQLPSALYEPVKNSGVKLIIDETYDLLANAKAAIVTSGTATLETAVFRVPQVVVYETSPFTYAIAKLLVKVKYISLVNLLAEKEVVKELIQSKFNPKELMAALNEILNKSDPFQEEYEKLYQKLKTPSVSDTAAKAMYEKLVQ